MKGPTPAYLGARTGEWTAELLNELVTNPGCIPEHWGKRDKRKIREALEQETFGKCAYCESRVRHIGWLRIDHIYSKNRYPERTFDWLNLTLACEICNVSKDESGPDNDLLNPYLDEPSDHLKAESSLILSTEGSIKGRVSVDVLQLNRPQLVERRVERIRYMALLVERHLANPQQQIFRDLIAEECRDDREYCLVVRGFVKGAMPTPP